MIEKAKPFLPSAVLLIGVLFVSGMRPQQTMQPVQPMRAIPGTFAEQAGKDTLVDPEEQKIAGMSDYVMRMYTTDSLHPFSIYVGYYDKQVQGKTIHSPKNCLPGAGWQIMTNEKVPLAGVANTPNINRVVLTNQGHRALVYYWYQGRGRIESNEYRVKWDLLRDAALYGRTEEALVRIVVPLAPLPTGGPDTALVAADSLARSVATPLATSVYKVLPPFRSN